MAMCRPRRRRGLPRARARAAGATPSADPERLCEERATSTPRCGPASAPGRVRTRTRRSSPTGTWPTAGFG